QAIDVRAYISAIASGAGEAAAGQEVVVVVRGIGEAHRRHACREPVVGRVARRASVRAAWRADEHVVRERGAGEVGVDGGVAAARSGAAHAIAAVAADVVLKGEVERGVARRAGG